VQDAPYVEYKGKVEKEEIDALVEQLNGAAATIIARGSKVVSHPLEILTAVSPAVTLFAWDRTATLRERGSWLQHASPAGPGTSTVTYRPTARVPTDA
jgi:hypothetical protein